MSGPAPRALVGDTPAAKDFFAGQYAKVAADTFDAASMELREEDVAFAVGALAFLGRVDDAVTCYEGFRRRAGPRDPRTVAASRFFLGVAFGRAGDFPRAHEHFVAGARARLRTPDPWVSAFVSQGLACHRYFTGKYRAAARHALRALRAAHVARFPYAQMLSTDLRGHALLQIGQFQAGTALLEQAKSYAERLGFGMNAHAVECSLVIYQAKFKAGPDALRDLESLLARRAHDSYSMRALLTEAAIQYALRGRGAEAAQALERVDRDALRMDARRAKVTSLIARLHVTRWSKGARACADLLDDAAALIDESDVAFRTELLAFEAYVGHALGDAGRYSAAASQLRRLARRTEHHEARAALEQFEGDRAGAFAEDELTPLLRAAVRRDERELPRLLALGFLGPVPELLGLTPGRRVVLLPHENAILVQDQGDLWLRPSPPRWAPPLLRLLAGGGASKEASGGGVSKETSGGGASKEALVAGLWGLRRYFPERHDPLVRTTIHRLRTFLDPRGEWVTVTPNGYGLAVPVHAVGADATGPLEAPLLEEDPPEDPPPRAAAPRASSGAAAAPELTLEAGTVDARLYTLLRQRGTASVPELIRALDMSESTLLRSLRRLVSAGKAARTGAARATRYEPR